MKPKFSFFSGYCRYFLFLPVMMSLEKPMENTPTRRVVARVGGQAELSCQVSPQHSVKYMEVRWFRSGHSQPVYLYRSSHGMEGEAAPGYVNRTEFVKEAIGEGKVALRIYNISISDDGLYQCSFSDDSGFIDVASVNLSVTAVGLETHIHVQGPAADGIMMECNSGGWFPQPQMEWRDSKGNTLLPSSKLYTQDETRFFHVKMSLLTNRSQGSIVCCIFNPVTGEEKQTSIILANDLFNEDHIWMNLLVVCASIMLFVFIMYIICSYLKPGCASDRLHTLLNSVPIQILSFLACAVVLFAVYLPLRIRVSISDPQFPLYNNWITELIFVIFFLLIFFVLPIIGLLLKQLGPFHSTGGTRMNCWQPNFMRKSPSGFNSTQRTVAN